MLPQHTAGARSSARSDPAGELQPRTLLPFESAERASNYRERWSDTGPWNHSDHRELGTALPDAVRDASNRWLFTEAGTPWSGVRWIAYNASTEPTHPVDVTNHLAKGVASLECQRAYIQALDDPDFDAESWLRPAAEGTGQLLGVDLAVAFELVPT